MQIAVLWNEEGHPLLKARNTGEEEKKQLQSFPPDGKRKLLSEADF